MTGDLPRPTPEGNLIRRVRSLTIPKLSIPAAGARIGLSAEQWGYTERGYYPARDGNPPRPFSPPPATLAKMARALRIPPERLESEGQRPDAAEILRAEQQYAAQIPLLVQRARNRAIEAAQDAAECIALGRIADARNLLAEAVSNLDTAEQRERGDQQR